MLKRIKYYFLPAYVLLCLMGITSVTIASEYIITSAAELSVLSLKAGDVVILQNGLWINQNLVLRGTGTVSAPITLKAETPGHVILNGSSTLKLAGEYLIVDGLNFRNGASTDDDVIEFRTSSSSKANNCRLTNTQIINYNPASIDTEYKWVSLYGTNNRVDHCCFEGKNHNGALLVIWLEDGIVNYHKIDSNYFGSRPDLGYNGGEIIRIGTSDYSMNDSYATVEHNLFEACDGEIEIISNKSCYNTYRYNTFLKCKGTLTLRHGNNCEVYGNFFFGGFKSECGGIRIIGENHKVYNNYLQDLTDDGFRSAISMVNGVPDSPLNRYFQVKNAEVVNNTLINCKHPITIGAGADSELSLSPTDCKIVNNVVAIYSGSVEDIIEYEDTPLNMVYQNNMVYGGSLGITQPEGIEIADPGLVLGDDFYRATDSSAVIGYGNSDYTYVNIDIDNQNRSNTNDAGCDQLSEEVISNKPLTKTDIGIDWESSIKEVSADEGGTKLTQYIESANDGDLIILTTSGGQYNIESSANLNANIELNADYNLVAKPIISTSGNVTSFIEFLSGSALSIENIDFENCTFNQIFNLDAQDSHIDSIRIENCDFSSVDGALLHASNNAALSDLQLINSRCLNIGAKLFDFESEAYVTTLYIENASFLNVNSEIIYFNNGANSQVTINHSTINNVAFVSNETPVLQLNDARIQFLNSIISNCGIDKTAFIFSGNNSMVNYSAFWQVGIPTASNSEVFHETNWTGQDPQFASIENLIFSLLPGSFALAAGNDSENLGDLFWDINNGQADNNSLLQSISINEKSISSFNENTFTYNVSILDSENYTIVGQAQSSLAEVKVRYPATVPGQAFIEVTADNQVNKSFYILNVSIGTSVSDNISENLMVVYPNPSNGLLFMNSLNEGWIEIYTSMGKKIVSRAVLSGFNEFDITQEPNGIYFLKFWNGHFYHVSKIIKQ
jgi:poly(beta-D-mannuronate) lyase